jgi:hypothetical protein
MIFNFLMRLKYRVNSRLVVVYQWHCQLDGGSLFQLGTQSTHLVSF